MVGLYVFIIACVGLGTYMYLFLYMLTCLALSSNLVLLFHRIPQNMMPALQFSQMTQHFPRDW